MKKTSIIIMLCTNFVPQVFCMQGIFSTILIKSNRHQLIEQITRQFCKQKKGKIALIDQSNEEKINIIEEKLKTLSTEINTSIVPTLTRIKEIESARERHAHRLMLIGFAGIIGGFIYCTVNDPSNY